MTWGQIPLDDQMRLTELYLSGEPLNDEAETYEMVEATLVRRIQERIEQFKALTATMPNDLRQDYLSSLEKYPNIQHLISTEVKQKPYKEQESDFKQELKRIESTKLGIDVSKIPDFPEILSSKHESVILEGDAIIVSDIEVPDYDTTILRLVLAMGIRHNIKRLIILGDFLAHDAFSSWPQVNNDDRVTKYNEEFAMAVDILLVWFTWFEEVVIIEGNHDRRINKITNGEIFLRWLMEVAFRFLGRSPIVTRRNHVYLNTPRGPWLLAHPLLGSSGVPGAMPKKMWTVERLPKELEKVWGKGVKPHMVTAHTHLYCSTTTPDSSRQILEIGCARSEEHTGYKQDKGVYAAWVLALGYIRQGYGRALAFEHTDWDYELGSELYQYVFNGEKEKNDVA